MNTVPANDLNLLLPSDPSYVADSAPPVLNPDIEFGPSVVLPDQREEDVENNVSTIEESDTRALDGVLPEAFSPRH